MPLPVTQEVEGSSPFGPADQGRSKTEELKSAWRKPGILRFRRPRSHTSHILAGREVVSKLAEPSIEGHRPSRGPLFS